MKQYENIHYFKDLSRHVEVFRIKYTKTDDMSANSTTLENKYSFHQIEFSGEPD